MRADLNFNTASHAWMARTDEFEQHDRIYGAAIIRQHLAIFQQILTEEESVGRASPRTGASPRQVVSKPDN